MRGEAVRRVLVTGAAGYVGGRLTAALEADGFEVLPLEADVRDAAAVEACFERAPALEAVIHLAAADAAFCNEHLDQAFAINSAGARRVLDAAARHGVRRFVLMSTFHVYGAEAGIVAESMPPRPRSVYAITKLAAEMLCRAACPANGVSLAIVRLSNVVGAPRSSAIGQWHLLTLDLCRQAHASGAITLRSSGEQWRDLVSFEDLHQAVRLLVEAPAEALADPVFNLGSGVSVRVRDLARLVQEAFAQAYSRAIPIVAPGGGEAGGEGLALAIDRLRGLGFRPTTDLRRAVTETLVSCEGFAR
jgi:UDP-glucose 4-epimerase